MALRPKAVELKPLAVAPEPNAVEPRSSVLAIPDLAAVAPAPMAVVFLPVAFVALFPKQYASSPLEVHSNPKLESLLRVPNEIRISVPSWRAPTSAVAFEVSSLKSTSKFGIVTTVVLVPSTI